MLNKEKTKQLLYGEFRPSRQGNSQNSVDSDEDRPRMIKIYQMILTKPSAWICQVPGVAHHSLTPNRGWQDLRCLERNGEGNKAWKDLMSTFFGAWLHLHRISRNLSVFWSIWSAFERIHVLNSLISDKT